MISLHPSQPRAEHTAILKNISYIVEVAYEWSHLMVTLLGLVLGVRVQEVPKVGKTSYRRGLQKRRLYHVPECLEHLGGL